LMMLKEKAKVDVDVDKAGKARSAARARHRAQSRRPGRPLIPSSALAVAVSIGASLLIAQTALAGPISCLDPTTCGWSISVDGSVVMSGSYQIAPDGSLSLPTAANFVGADFSVDITNIGGNVDPEIVFGVGATNTSGAAKTFAFAFNLPLLGLTGPVDTEAALAVTLTAPTTGSGLTLFPTSGTGFIVDSQDIRFSPFSSVDKGVDIGGALFDPAGGLATVTNDLVQSQINLVGPYDVMTVIVAFGLDSNGGVGLSGRVTQTPVPEPGTAMFLGLGLGMLASRRRA